MIGRADLTWRFWRVWRRNMVVSRRIWKVNFLVPLLEPAFYILAFGLGFTGLVGNLTYAGQELSYTAFIAPALMASAIMNNGFFETTYASFVRMYYQKTFDGILATPLSLEELIVAEMVSGATKSTLATTLMLAVLAPLGYAHLPLALLAIPLAFLGGLAFATIGMWFTGITPSIDMFNLPVFLFVTPMFLSSGTFFPMDGLPGWAQVVAWSLPLAHLVDLCRGVCLGRMAGNVWLSLGYLLAFCLLFGLLALRAMRRRLIR